MNWSFLMIYHVNQLDWSSSLDWSNNNNLVIEEIKSKKLLLDYHSVCITKLHTSNLVKWICKVVAQLNCHDSVLIIIRKRGKRIVCLSMKSLEIESNCLGMWDAHEMKIWVHRSIRSSHFRRRGTMALRHLPSLHRQKGPFEI